MSSPVVRKAAGAVVATILAMFPVALHQMQKHEGTGPTVHTSEGLRYKAYADPYLGWKTPTICYGHTKGVKKGDIATQAQCDAWLQEDIVSHCNIVKPWPTTQGEVDAYCSFAYNTGKFKSAPSVHDRYVQGDRWGACMGLLKYYYSDGKPSRGLWNRRYDEYNNCISNLPIKYKGYP